ncbi:ATP-binding protein [Lysinibacillus parviboronicapiens]
MSTQLFIVKKVVELHGGQVNVTSKIGKGSTFEIKLPIRRS